MKLNLRLTLFAAVILLFSVSAVWAENFSNFALTSLNATIGPSDTTLTVVSAANFPGTAPFRLTIQDSQASTPEIVMVTAISGNTYTIVRGIEGTTASGHSSGAQVAQFVTAGVISQIFSQFPVGSTVGTTDTQTLTNKTISGSNNTLTNIPAANLTGTAPNTAIPTPTTSALGGIIAQASATAHQVVQYINASGQQVLAQLGFSDLTGSASASQMPAFTGDTHTSAGATATTTDHVNGVAYPASPSTNTVPVVTGTNQVTYGPVPVANSTGTLPAANGGSSYVTLPSSTGSWLQLTGGLITSGTSTLNATSATFGAGDVGKLISVYGAGASGAALNTTIASVIDSHDVTLAVNASATTSGAISNAYLGGTQTTQSGAGSYVPGDTITTAGGTNTAQAIFNVLDTRLASATANATGSGGTTGACILTGTTGTGPQKFQINATIAGGSISAIGSIITAGQYSTNPTSLTAEPVTSNCSLSGATLTVKMGAGDLTLNAGGLYTAIPSNPVSQASTSGSGTGATLNLKFTISGAFEYGFDDTTAIQATINAAPIYSTVYAPCGLYRISGAFTISVPLTFKGCGAYPISNDGQILSVAPYVAGTVFYQTAAATDIFDIPVSAGAVNLYDFGWRFADQIRFINTGDGIHAIPSTTAGGKPGTGLQWGNWQRLIGFGGDGNHYGLNLLNAMYYGFDSMRMFGGGGLQYNNNSAVLNTGNAVFQGLYVDILQYGTANGVTIAGIQTGSTGEENLDLLLRPQVILGGNQYFPETTSPNLNTQSGYTDNFGTQNISIVSPDFEPISMPVKRNNATGFVTPDGFMGSNVTYNLLQGFLKGGNSRFLSNEGAFVGGPSTSSTSISMLAAAGTSPPSPVVGAKGDFAMSITFGSGGSPTSGQVIQVTYGVFRGGEFITCSPNNAATAALGTPYVVGAGGNYQIGFPTNLAASQPNTTYAITCSGKTDW